MEEQRYPIRGMSIVLLTSISIARMELNCNLGTYLAHVPVAHVKG